MKINFFIVETYIIPDDVTDFILIGDKKYLIHANSMDMSTVAGWTLIESTNVTVPQFTKDQVMTALAEKSQEFRHAEIARLQAAIDRLNAQEQGQRTLNG